MPRGRWIFFDSNARPHVRKSEKSTASLIMTLLNNGQPIGGIIQVAYTVADIQAAVRSYAEDLRIGPWFLRGPLQAREPIYRGAPQNLMLSIAIAYSGHVMIELIQQHDDQASVYRESFEKNGHGFQRWGIASDRYDHDLASYLDRGFELVFTRLRPQRGSLISMRSEAGPASSS